MRARGAACLLPEGVHLSGPWALPFPPAPASLGAPWWGKNQDHELLGSKSFIYVDQFSFISSVDIQSMDGRLDNSQFVNSCKSENVQGIITCPEVAFYGEGERPLCLFLSGSRQS